MNTQTTLFKISFCILFLLNTLVAKAQSPELVQGPNGLYGYINNQTGEMVTDYRYQEAKPFSQGFAAVRWGEYWGFIRENGEDLLPCQYRFVASFQGGRAMVQYDRLRGFIDRTGALVIPMEYQVASSFAHNLACVQKDRSWGFIDTMGKVVIKLQFERAYPFSDGLACVSKKGRYGYIDSTGRVAIKLQFSNASPFSEGLAPVKKKDRWGYIDRTGKEIIGFNYVDAGRFSNGLACVGDGKKFGFINTEGKWVIPMEYDSQGHFNRDGLVRLRRDGEQFYVNRQGEATKIDSAILEEEISFMVVDEKPKFMGGDENGFTRWVNQNIEYPSTPGQIQAEGMVMLTFVVDAYGYVSEVEALRSFHPELDREAVRVVQSSPRWTPGRQNGEAVKVRYNFPIIFRLQTRPSSSSNPTGYGPPGTFNSQSRRPVRPR
ncbi:MAG: TonB family protein [Bacteroidales bacterium]|nr:TonB family protein [Bacteroidales bacterium]